MTQYYDIKTYKQYDRDVKLAVRRGLDGVRGTISTPPHFLNSCCKFIQFVDTAARLCRVHLLLLRRDMLLRSSYVVSIQNIF